MLTHRATLLITLLSVTGLGCSDSSDGTDGATDAFMTADGGAGEDGGPGVDASAPEDGGPEADASACADEQCYCEATGGSWDETACGHYMCGVPNDCRAVIPGCDCGFGENFVDGAGCAADDSCTCDTDECLCESTGGTWDETACGDYSCGAPNPCAAIIPGCDCGFSENFVDGAGCETDPSCTCDTDECLCESTGGTWDETACGDYMCGMPNLCDAIIPGCDCGADANFGDEGCASDPSC
jgi:hypothetical protein